MNETAKKLMPHIFFRNGVEGEPETVEMEMSRGLGGGRGGGDASGGPSQTRPSGHLSNIRQNGKLHNYRTSSVDICPGLWILL